MEKGYEYLMTYGVNLVAAILIFIIGKWVSGVLYRSVIYTCTTNKQQVKSKLIFLTC